MKKGLIHTALIGLLGIHEPALAQYWGERVLEKGFEQSNMFFVPSTLNPFGIGNFGSTTPGLLNDPLLNLSVNPAHVQLDSLMPGYFYADFRSARTILDNGYQFTPPWLMYAASDVAMRSYPWVYLNTRKELEPVFSGAYIARPMPETLPDLLVGGSYQLILQDDKYYGVPQDIYRSVIGMDYAGNREAAAANIPVVDRYSGQDNMHQRGDFASLFGRYEIKGLGALGIKAGRVLFDRSGNYGSSNLWGNQAYSGTSLWSNLESRSQSYHHWEITGGIDFYVNDRTTIGATAGWLWGEATQAQHRGDSSYYSWSSTPNQGLSVRSGNTQQEWRHDGRTHQLGIDITTRPTDHHTLHFLYQRQRTNVDIGLGTGILDTSYSSYSYTYLDTPATSTSYYVLTDRRNGFGSQVSTSSRILASIQWQLDARVSLALGLQFDWQDVETSTSEDVLARMGSVYQTSQGNYNWINRNEESKDLLWTFTARKTSFQIPIFFTIKTSDVIEILLGLNRAMTHSRVDDATLALFRYRRSNNNGTVTNTENFGELYSNPREDESDVRTTFLAGLTASPSRHLRLRLLVVPNFRDTFEGSQLEDLQWWIGVNILP